MSPLRLDKKAIGDRIRKLRKLKDWTQEQLGQKANLNSNVIRSYEVGKAFPKVEGLHSLANALEVPIEWLLTGTGAPDISEKIDADLSPVDEMIVRTQAILRRNLSLWNTEWQWLKTFDVFLSDRDLMRELAPTTDELLQIRDCLLYTSDAADE